jgi:hypothetical protein
MSSEMDGARSPRSWQAEYDGLTGSNGEEDDEDERAHNARDLQALLLLFRLKNAHATRHIQNDVCVLILNG